MAKLIHLKLDEPAGSTTFVNSGTAGGSWLMSTNPPIPGYPAKRNFGLNFPGDDVRRYIYGDTTFNTLEPATISVGVWIFLRSYPPSFPGHVAHKVYRAGTDWGSPWAAWWIGINGNTSQPVFTVTTGAMRRDIISPDWIPLNQWVHLALIYDSATRTHRGYINGFKVGEVITPTGVIDYGTHGRYMIGHCNDGSGAIEELDGLIDDFQLHDTIVPIEELMGEPPSYGVDRVGHALDGNTLALWRMDEPLGVEVRDETGSYPLIAQSAAIVSDGRFGKGRNFISNATTSRITGPADDIVRDAFRSDGSITIELWARTDNVYNWFANLVWLASSGTVGGAQEDNTLLCFTFEFNESSLLAWWERGAGIKVSTGITKVPTFVLGKWYHFAMVRTISGTTATVSFYYNGELLRTVSDLPAPDGGSNANWVIGRISSDPGGFVGVIDDVRVSNVARTPEEIRASYAATFNWNGAVSKPHAAPDWTQARGGGRGGRINGGFN